MSQLDPKTVQCRLFGSQNYRNSFHYTLSNAKTFDITGKIVEAIFQMALILKLL